MSSSPGPDDRGRYWDDRYQQIGVAHVSWFEARPNTSMALINTLAVNASTAVIDVGGGSSSLARELVGLGFDDLTVLDVSRAALEQARQRCDDPTRVTWLHADILSWSPTRRWGLWHDRALFHFLTQPADRNNYLHQLTRALTPNGSFIIATFTPDGPEQCSGLPVNRYNAETLNNTITTAIPNATIITTREALHTTPSGTTQPFTWTAGTITAT